MCLFFCCNKSSLADLLNHGWINQGEKWLEQGSTGGKETFWSPLPATKALCECRKDRQNHPKILSTHLANSWKFLPTLYLRSPCKAPGLFWEDGTADEHMQSLVSEVLDSRNTRHDLVSAPMSALGFTSHLQRAVEYIQTGHSWLLERQQTQVWAPQQSKKAWQLLGGTKAEQILERWWNTLWSKESSPMRIVTLPTRQDKARTEGWLLKGRGEIIKLYQAVGRRWIAKFHSGSLQTHNCYWKDVKATQFKRDKWIEKN